MASFAMIRRLPKSFLLLHIRLYQPATPRTKTFTQIDRHPLQSNIGEAKMTGVDKTNPLHPLA